MRAIHRQVAGMIAPAFLLLVGAVVLFINNNHAEIFKRRKQRGAGADDNRRLAIFRFQPRRKTLAVVQAGMQNFHRGIKTFTKTGDSLRCQADFRHHHQRLFALSEHVFQYAEINLRFTGTGNARQQPGRKSICRAMNCANGGGLFGIQSQPLTRNGIVRLPVAKLWCFTC